MATMPNRFRPLPIACAALLAIGAGCTTTSGRGASASPAVAPARTTPAPSATAESPTAVPRYSIEQFLATTSLSGASFSPDGGKILVSSNQTGVINAFAVPVSGGEPIQLTRSDESVRVAGYFPTDERFLFTSDRGGNELSHLYVRELDGSARDLTPGDKVKAEFLDWSLDGRSFFALSNERDPSYFDVLEFAIDGYGRRTLFENRDGYSVASISPDRRYLALGKDHTAIDSDLYLHDLGSGETRHLTPHQGEVSFDAGPFDPSGRWLYVRTNDGGEFQRLMRYEIASGRRETVAAPDWDVSDVEVSRDGRYLAVSVNRDGRTEVTLHSLPDLEPIPLPALPDAEITSVTFARDGSRLAFYADASRSPANLYVYDLGTRELKPLTRTLNPEIDAAHLVDAQVVRFRARDGVVIPGLLYRPKEATATAKVPAIVWVHGGPGDQSRVGYRAAIQYLVNHGYAVYAINNRGSSGYGKTFFSLDDRKHGDADLGDCIDSKAMLAATGWVDAERIGILGGSYGGYMVLAALTFAPTEFAVGVDVYGVSNWLRTLESVPAWWESQRKLLYKELGDPAVDRDYLIKISPLFHADRIARPMLVLQGANDPRVLKAESDEIVAAARNRGVPVEYLVFPDEGHGFVKKANQAKANEAILRFLDRYLKGDAGS